MRTEFQPIRVEGVPLEQVEWVKVRRQFTATKGDEELLFTEFSSDITGNIWSLNLLVLDTPFKIVVFCLGDEPSGWQTNSVGEREKLPSQQALEMAHEIIKEAKSSGEFIKLQP